MPMPDLSIIIVNWNSAAYLRKCLASIYQHTRETSFELVVVDNASTEDCNDMLTHDFPDVRLIAAETNLGFARANNLGASATSGRILLFLNPDTEVSSDALSDMAVWLQAHPGSGAVGAPLLNSDGSLQDSCVQSFPTILNQILDCALLRRYFPNSTLWGTRSLYSSKDAAAKVDAISGACFMVRRAVFEAVGGFTESYFMYAEDLDLSYKIHRAGFEVVCLSSCEVLHYGGTSSGKQSTHFAAVLQREAIAHFLAMSRGRIYSAAYRATTGIASLVRLGLVLCSLPFASEARGRHRAISILAKWLAIFTWSIGLRSSLRLRGSQTHA